MNTDTNQPIEERVAELEAAIETLAEKHASGPMGEASTDDHDGVREDDQGRTWVDLTRRQTLAGLGGLAGVIAAGLGTGQSADEGEVGPAGTTVGESPRVPSTELEQVGTCQALFVAIRPEHLPENPPTPAIAYCLEGGPRVFAGPPPYAETDTLRSNLAELRIADDPSGSTVDRTPALLVSRQAPGLQLVVGDDRHQRSVLAGNAARVHAGAAQSDLPTLESSETPALGVTRENGTRVDL